MQIIAGDFTDPRIITLLGQHLNRARAVSPPQSTHALDLTGLQTPDISVWAAWDDEILLGVGALKQLAPDHGEIKSMHTAAAMRNRGVASAMLRHILITAKARGYLRLSLETGAMDYFQPARALYLRFGFTECGPFGEYAPDPHSVFMTLSL
jgi:putative acetyltransferase